MGALPRACAVPDSAAAGGDDGTATPPPAKQGGQGRRKAGGKGAEEPLREKMQPGTKRPPVKRKGAGVPSFDPSDFVFEDLSETERMGTDR